MPGVCFAILAHNRPECLADLVQNLRAFAPGSPIVLYNGGHDATLADGLDIEVCELSAPVQWARQFDFLLGTMRWLHRERRPYDYLVGLDSDMLLVQHGFDRLLDRVMSRSAYLGTGFHEVLRTNEWPPGRRFHYRWRTVWQPLTGAYRPYGCFNPGQVFRRDLVERVLAHPRLDELAAAVRRSSLPVLEELVWPTLAAALDPSAASSPGSRGIRNLRAHAPSDVDRYRREGDVHLVHPVHMDPDAPDRAYIRRLALGQPADVTAFDAAFRDYVAARARGGKRGFVRRAIAPRLRDLYLRVVP